MKTDKKLAKNYEKVEIGESESESSAPTSGLEPKKRGCIENLTARGRPKGVPNKLTRTFKQAAEEAFSTYVDEKRNIRGGVEWLQSLMGGTSSDRAAVIGLYGRLIPAQLQAEVKNDINVTLNWAVGRQIGKTITPDTQSVGNVIEHQDVSDAEVTYPDSRQHIDNNIGSNTDTDAEKEW